MKKLIFSTLILTALFSCKKNEAPNQLTEETTTETVDSSAVTPANALPEVNQEQLKAMVAPQKNDTIYVTNFFATWCPPSIKEIPHFKQQMAELKSQPVKFTFISLDNKDDWDTKVKTFSEEQGLSENVVLLDGSLLTSTFFPANFKQWDGGSIPFTIMRKGDKTDETVGMMSEQALIDKINSFK